MYLTKQTLLTMYSTHHVLNKANLFVLSKNHVLQGEKPPVIHTNGDLD